MTFHPTNLAVHVLASTNITYRNGRSISIQSWDGGWTRETSLTDYNTDGTRRSTTLSESSDCGTVTNGVTVSDLLGRVVATITPLGITSNFYDGVTSRLIRSEATGQAVTLYTYDALGESAATVQSGITTASENRYETIDAEVWQVAVRSTSSDGITNAVSTTRQQMTGLSNALRSRTVSIDPNGSTATEESVFDQQTCELTTTRTTDSATPSITVSKFGRPIRRQSLRETVYNYFDPLGRAEYFVAYHPVTDELLYDRWSAFDESDNETDYGIYYYGDDLHVTGSRTFDAFNREVTRTDALGNTVTTAYDALGRPVASSGATYPVCYGYDTMGRMKTLGTTRDGSVFDETRWIFDHATGLATNKIYADDSAVAYAYTYAYDHIGNHTTSSVNSETATYAANALNQYTAISNLVQSCNPVHDLDGNMLTNGVWAYSYDAENRLTAAYSNSVCVVSNAYDHASRRVLKVTPTATHVFVYDGWNLVQETVSTASGVMTNAYIWGKDLSGTMQGAGGVGGMLATCMAGDWYFPLTDANGNITAYVNEQGVVVAEYVYDAFGANIAASGSMCDIFRHRFSTKYFDAETGLCYYGYRFYHLLLHRWLNRDPIEEDGSENLYAFCKNSPYSLFDILGLEPDKSDVDPNAETDSKYVSVPVEFRVWSFTRPDLDLSRDLAGGVMLVCMGNGKMRIAMYPNIGFPPEATPNPKIKVKKLRATLDSVRNKL